MSGGCHTKGGGRVYDGWGVPHKGGGRACDEWGVMHKGVWGGSDGWAESLHAVAQVQACPE